jgi:2-dehydro-3-deoxygalactonokinase
MPILMSGMIGSRQGWREAPYVRCPAPLDALATHLARVETRGLGEIAIVPGIDTIGFGGIPDVMRGEETQILGTLALGRRDGGLFVLPGTHSKWVTAERGAITAFRTFMTGEAFAALKDHTILGRLADPNAATTPDAFRRGVETGARDGAPGDLLNRIFSARTLGLFGALAPGDVSDYLSGLLIGAEIAAAVPRGTAVTVIAGNVLATRYLEAAAVLGLDASPGPADVVVAGQVAIARTAGLISGAP